MWVDALRLRLCLQRRLHPAAATLSVLGTGMRVTDAAPQSQS